MSYGAVDRHKQSGHVAEALAVYAEHKRGWQFDVARGFERNVDRLGKAQDAADLWLTDPNDPERYYLGPRDHEVEVVYDDYADRNDRGEPRRKRDTLRNLLRRVEEKGDVGAVRVHEKFSDPRDYLLKSSEQLREEARLWMQAIELLRLREVEARQARLQAAEEEREAADLLTLAFEQHLAADIAYAFNGLLDPAVGQQVAEYAAPRLLARLIERFQEGGEDEPTTVEGEEPGSV